MASVTPITNLLNDPSQIRTALQVYSPGQLTDQFYKAALEIKQTRSMCSNLVGETIEDYPWNSTVWFHYHQLWTQLLQLTQIIIANSMTDRLVELRRFKELFLIDLLGLRDYQLVFNDATASFDQVARTIFDRLTDLDLDHILENILNYQPNQNPAKCSALQYLLDDLRRYDHQFALMVQLEATHRDELVQSLGPLFSQLLELQLRALIKKTKREAPDVSKFVKRLSIVLSNKLKTVNAVLSYQSDPSGEEARVTERQADRKAQDSDSNMSGPVLTETTHVKQAN